MRFLAAEITREQVYRALHDELPYAITVETENWKDQKDGAARIEQVIFVERDSQKKIVLGEGGQMIKRIGAAARKEMEQQFERRSEEHTSELQSLMRISYAVFCLTKNNQTNEH